MPGSGFSKEHIAAMATRKETVASILDQLVPLPVRARAMFGEYGLYCDEKIVALICDDTLFVKPTAISGEFLSDDWLAPPYPGAKDSYAVPLDRLEDRDWLQDVIERTAAELPVPNRKKKA
jgi:TfoX/Sxy family transcriptional regulator of competence genes